MPSPPLLSTLSALIFLLLSTSTCHSFIFSPSSHPLSSPLLSSSSQRTSTISSSTLRLYATSIPPSPPAASSSTSTSTSTLSPPSTTNTNTNTKQPPAIPIDTAFSSLEDLADLAFTEAFGDDENAGEIYQVKVKQREFVNGLNLKKRAGGRKSGEDGVMSENDGEPSSSSSESSESTSYFTPKNQAQTHVGSAIGWSLEVLPGDYVVHKKYGIGRFERSFYKKRKLTREERMLANRGLQRVIDAERGDADADADVGGSADNTDDNKEKDNDNTNKVLTLEISYSDGTLHVPSSKAYRLSRYRSGSGESTSATSSTASTAPKLSKMTSDAWRKQRSKAMELTEEIAEEVLSLYATRETLKRPAFRPEVESEVNEFSQTFSFTPTPDQASCFKVIENDMVWRTRPMDRLICGDVGFGKTEVALRAIVRCLANGRQAALLAPTSVLAAQHYKTVVERMGNGTKFNRNIVLLRGGVNQSSPRYKQVQARMKSGEVELVIGTHAILSKGVGFKDLGLLVIDEEQRFGVKQKERLKILCSGVDVLTLSATPIPRTLQMSLSGIRDTSTIRSPPPLRLPIITNVLPFSMAVVKQAITKELARGGQCFFVVPRIAMLEEANRLLLSACPGLRVLLAHGRLRRGLAEENVAAFAEGKADVLLATTVIENGIDIPRVNTIIVSHATFFGLSTLYQLRGRVGRSCEQAYAYLFYPPSSDGNDDTSDTDHDRIDDAIADPDPMVDDKLSSASAAASPTTTTTSTIRSRTITEQAQQRLNAISTLTSLGSGFSLANRDLEIRGAGSLFGVEQSGMAGKVGFDLYMRMLRVAIKRIRGLSLPTVARTAVYLDKGKGSGSDSDSGSGEGNIEGPNAFVVDVDYMENAEDRTTAANDARLAESSKRLVEITNKWKEKHGPIPDSMKGPLKSMHLHSCTRILGVDEIHIDLVSGDGVLRAPGLRQRHVRALVEEMGGKLGTGLGAGVGVYFPASTGWKGEGGDGDGEEVDIDDGGLQRAFNRNSDKNSDGNAEGDGGEDEWDEYDEEETHEGSSSAIADPNDITKPLEAYPAIIIKDLRSVKEGCRVDRILKTLLPIVDVVLKKQRDDYDMVLKRAKKREFLNERKKGKEEGKMKRNKFGFLVEEEVVKNLISSDKGNVV